MLSGLKFLLGLMVFLFMWAIFAILMLILALKDANAVMGAPDQTEDEKELSECRTDTECCIAYDKVHGAGSCEMLERIMRECGANSPGEDCYLERRNEAFEPGFEEN